MPVMGNPFSLDDKRLFPILRAKGGAEVGEDLVERDIGEFVGGRVLPHELQDAGLLGGVRLRGGSGGRQEAQGQEMPEQESPRLE
jgi:hypothetical protein